MTERQRQSEIYLEHVLMVHAVSKRSGVGFATAMIQALVPWLKAQELTERERRIVADGELATRTDPMAEKARTPAVMTYAVRGVDLVRFYVRGRNRVTQWSTIATCEAMIDAAEGCGSIGFYYAKLVRLCQDHPRPGVAFSFLRLVGAFVPHASGQGSRSRLAPDARAKLAAGIEAHTENTVPIPKGALHVTDPDRSGRPRNGRCPPRADRANGGETRSGQGGGEDDKEHG